MNEEDSSEKKLKEIAGANDLSSAIKKLEEKKQSIEDGLKVHAHNMVHNLSPVNVLDQTLENVKQSSSQDSLFNEALAFGAGYLSKRRLIHQFKNAIIKTFRKAAMADNSGINFTVQMQDNDQKENPMNNTEEIKNPAARVETVKAKPEILPKPTYWPFFLALGIVFLGWGLLTTWLISVAGLIILITALSGWLNILRHE
ncbi:hypothetical protein [Hanamia caeni]|jgi:hypothetical protein|nr:hypothetical protein [Hanamia caeni]